MAFVYVNHSHCFSSIQEEEDTPAARLACPPLPVLMKNSVLAATALLVATGDLVPVDHVPPGREIVGSAVLVLEIVGVFPHVVAHHRIQAVHQGAILVGGGHD